MRSRFLLDLTTPEVESYLAKSGKTALFPIGCVEMHGPHQPLGTDTFVAQGVALKLAETVDALILPELSYTWAGASDGFAGTISVEPEVSTALAASVLRKTWRMGFTRLVLLSIHAPNQMAFRLLARRLFETDAIPVLFVDVYAPLSDAAGGIFSGEASKGKEASFVLAALEALGRPTLYSENAMRAVDQTPPRSDHIYGLRGATVGYFMQDAREHACPTPAVSIDLGRQFLAEQVKALAPLLADYGRYCDQVGIQKNQGFWR